MAEDHRVDASNFWHFGQARGGAMTDLHARARAMTSDEATDAWLRFLLRTGPRADGVVLRVIAERLATTTEPDELLALAGDLVATSC